MNVGNDNYKTDEWIREIFDLDNWFDPCPLRRTYGVDGLKIQWGQRTFCNPPYSNPLPWVKKAIAEINSNNSHMVVMLLRMDTSTEWFKLLQNAGAKFLWINGRLKFNTGKPANFPSMLVILNEKENKKEIGE